MPWQDLTVERLREELVLLSLSEGANVSELCRRFGVSRKTLYKWRKAYLSDPSQELKDASRRPRSSPRRSQEQVEAAVLALREAHPTWGGRKICAALRAENRLERVPCASTATEILRRHGLLDPERAEEPRNWRRFERERPNELWQMDFKGHFPTLAGRCHPLTLLDDHSRFSLGIWACSNEQGATVRACLEEAFRRYGLPLCVLCDNGGPWSRSQGLSRLEAWLIRLGIAVSHGRSYHPETQGKLERFHRTLKADVLQEGSFADLEKAQERFERWRAEYNADRPHEALGGAAPASRYVASPRSFPERLPEPEYGPDDCVRKVQKNGWVFFKGKEFRVGDGLEGQPVAFRQEQTGGVYALRFCSLRLALVDLRGTDATVTYVSEQV